MQLLTFVIYITACAGHAFLSKKFNPELLKVTYYLTLESRKYRGRKCDNKIQNLLTTSQGTSADQSDGESLE